jgi:hypothetical protein
MWTNKLIDTAECELIDKGEITVHQLISIINRMVDDHEAFKKQVAEECECEHI